MVANMNVGASLYGALAYNGQKINEGEGKLLLSNKIVDDGTGTMDIARAASDFERYLPPAYAHRETHYPYISQPAPER